MQRNVTSGSLLNGETHGRRDYVFLYNIMGTYQGATFQVAGLAASCGDVHGDEACNPILIASPPQTSIACLRKAALAARTCAKLQAPSR